MATYDLTSSLPAASSLVAGDILNCPYSGTYKTIELPRGTYKLQCWGARGGRGPGSNGANVSGNANYGRGGYSIGTIKLPTQTTVYLYTGGAGADATGINATAYAGGWNGGGNGGALASTSSATNGSGGGGASDIRIGSTSLYARVIVAGGGGGASWYTDTYTSPLGGAGGGTSGVAASLGGSSNSSYYTAAQPGTATSGGAGGQVSSSTYGTVGNAGSFGNGGSGPSNSSSIINSGAGGGGGWYGGGSGFAAKGGAQGHGAGGSGYVYTSSTASNYPEGCLLNSNYYLSDASTVAGDSSIIDPESGSSVTGRSGHGYVRIIVIKVSSGSTLVKIPQILPSTYSLIEYLQFTGTQYIDTGAIVDSNTGFDITFEVLNGQSSSPYYNLFGVRGNDSSGGTSETQNFFRIDTIPVDSNSGTEFKYGSTVYNSGITNTSKINIKLVNKIYTKPDGSTITLSGDITSGLPMYIGCINKAGEAYGNKSSMKLDRFKIYNGSTLAHDFIPVQRISDKVLGLYDLKTSTFKTNLGSGVFTSNLMNDPSSLAYFNGDSLQSQGNLSLTVTNNNVTLSNEQTHFGKNSLKFDGSSSYMYMPFPSTYTGDITIEGWFYQTSNNNTSYPTPFTLISSAGRGMYMHRLSSQTFVAATPSNSWPGLGGGTTALNTWTHIAMCLSGTTTYCFLDGKLKGTLTDTNTSYVGLTLGTLAESASSNHQSGCYYKGYIAELKVSKGCKWTKDFTLPAAPYSTAKDSSPWKEQKNIFIKTPTILPSGYTQLEYLQSSGTQYINTNMFYTHVKATYEIMSVGSTYIAIFGSRTSSSSSNQFAFGYAAHQSPKLWRFDYENEHQALDSLTVGTELPWDGKHTISIDSNNGSILIDNNLINLGFSESIEVSSALPLYLFALNTNGTAGEIGNTRIYSFKLYDTNFNFMSEKPVLNLVPARNSSGALGMYDTISGKFYTNAGTGTFIAGPDTNPWKQAKDLWIKIDSTTWKQVF